MVDQDGFRTPNPSPRRGSTSWPAKFIPIEIRPYVRAFSAANLAGEQRFQIGQPDISEPLVSADRRRMAALVVGAIDQESTNARCSHFPEGDFLLAAFYRKNLIATLRFSLI
jgi:hypothetical protein